MANQGPKFPKAIVKINLDNEQQSPFYIIGEVRRALKEEGATPRLANQFNADVMSGDYNHMMDVVEKWVKVKWSGRDPRIYGERG